jgi:hypothetical protein
LNTLGYTTPDRCSYYEILEISHFWLVHRAASERRTRNSGKEMRSTSSSSGTQDEGLSDFGIFMCTPLRRNCPLDDTCHLQNPSTILPYNGVDIADLKLVEGRWNLSRLKC